MQTITHERLEAVVNSLEASYGDILGSADGEGAIFQALGATWAIVNDDDDVVVFRVNPRANVDGETIRSLIQKTDVFPVTFWEVAEAIVGRDQRLRGEFGARRLVWRGALEV